MLALPDLDPSEMRQGLGSEEILSPFLSDASGRQHQPALIVHNSSPTYMGRSAQRMLRRLAVSSNARLWPKADASDRQLPAKSGHY